MNFDFLRDIEGLEGVFKCCNNAEELALTQPENSMSVSRKSAEFIAKYVYGVAHLEAAGRKGFLEILQDQVVIDYINNSSVLDAFHYIRMNGNQTTHTLDEKSSKAAVEILEKLHYTVGEIAKTMNLVSDYPPFNRDIIEHPEAVPFDDRYYGMIEKELYNEFLVYRHKIDVLKAQFSELSARFRFSPGNVDEHEIIEFKEQPKMQETIYRIQEYFGTVGNHALKRIVDNNEDERIPYQLELSLFGENGYTTRNLVDALYGILYDLPQAEGFRITSYYSGPQISSLFDEYRDSLVGFYNLGDFISFEEVSSYKKYEFLFNHGAGGCMKYEDGNWLDLRESYNKKVVRKSFGKDWWTWEISLVIDFDFEKYPSIIQSLHDAVRKHVPESELEYCESNWTGEDPEMEILLDGIQWCPRKLQEVQAFLDEVNKAILPIKDECEFKYDGEWFITESPMAIATFKWTDDGFKVVGTKL